MLVTTTERIKLTMLGRPVVFRDRSEQMVLRGARIVEYDPSTKGATLLVYLEGGMETAYQGALYDASLEAPFTWCLLSDLETENLGKGHLPPEEVVTDAIEPDDTVEESDEEKEPGQGVDEDEGHTSGVGTAQPRELSDASKLPEGQRAG